MSQVRLCIKVDRYSECRAFYEKELRWKIFREWDRGRLEQGVVYHIHGSSSLLEIERHWEPSTTLDRSFYLLIEVEGVRSLRDEMKGKGLEPTEVRSFPWGHTSFMVQDPAGMLLKFFEEGRD